VQGEVIHSSRSRLGRTGSRRSPIDGEVVVPSANGTTDFSVLQSELKARSKEIVLIAFELLYLDGRDLRKLPLFDRKGQLKKLVAKL
jgi:bifunctional non-homologous end joining protein LigD